MTDAWGIWFILCFALGWAVRGLGKPRVSNTELRDNVRELARVTSDLEKRLSELERERTAGQQRR